MTHLARWKLSRLRAKTGTRQDLGSELGGRSWMEQSRTKSGSIARWCDAYFLISRKENEVIVGG